MGLAIDFNGRGDLISFEGQLTRPGSRILQNTNVQDHGLCQLLEYVPIIHLVV